MCEESAKVRAAREYYLRGYNCAQAVLAAFHEEVGMTEDAALRMSSSFGGGMAGLREVCGAISSMFMVLGAAQGYDIPNDLAAKRAHYAHLHGLADEFAGRFGTYICRDLLKSAGVQPVAEPAERTPEYYKTRPCTRFIEACAAMTERELQPKK